MQFILQKIVHLDAMIIMLRHYDVIQNIHICKNWNISKKNLHLQSNILTCRLRFRFCLSVTEPEYTVVYEQVQEFEDSNHTGANEESKIASQVTWKRNITNETQIAKFMGPTWGPPGSCRPQMGPMLALWTLISGNVSKVWLLLHCPSPKTAVVVILTESLYIYSREVISRFYTLSVNLFSHK